ncbi:MAG: SPOR domain-containing protein [Candidatus Dadabacteria bacterium]|nr:MAG: SPOR domain-containing protein [Candidatus Dadabacteria bacterium]
MSNNSGTNNSKIISLFITFAVLFIVVFSLGVIIGKGLGGSDTQTIERSYDEDVSSEKFSEPELVGEGSIVQDSNLTEIESKELPKESDSESKEETEPLEVSIEKSPLENQGSTPAKSAMPKIDSSGRYTVQIGAFQDQSQANRLLNSMKSKGYPVFIKQMESPDNKRWYRVRVGTFSTRDDAISYGDKIKEKEARIKSVFITVNN